MEQFEDFDEWANTLLSEGCAPRCDDRGVWWAENWEGKSCGEWYPWRNSGYLNFG